MLLSSATSQWRSRRLRADVCYVNFSGSDHAALDLVISKGLKRWHPTPWLRAQIAAKSATLGFGDNHIREHRKWLLSLDVGDLRPINDGESFDGLLRRSSGFFATARELSALCAEFEDRFHG